MNVLLCVCVCVFLCARSSFISGLTLVWALTGWWLCVAGAILRTLVYWTVAVEKWGGLRCKARFSIDPSVYISLIPDGPKLMVTIQNKSTTGVYLSFSTNRPTVSLSVPKCYQSLSSSWLIACLLQDLALSSSRSSGPSISYSSQPPSTKGSHSLPRGRQPTPSAP